MTPDEHKPPADLTAILNQLWARFLPEIHERAALLQTVAQACATGSITPEQHEAAHAAAHKLAGSLGTFGLSQGSELAREFESMCSSDEFCTPTQALRLTAIAAEIRNIIAARK